MFYVALKIFRKMIKLLNVIKESWYSFTNNHMFSLEMDRSNENFAQTA